MREVTLYIAMSLDGYIADAKGGVDWIIGQNPYITDVGSYEDFIQEIDTIILGYNTYHQIITKLSPGKWPYKGIQSYVLTHRKIGSQEDINFVRHDAALLINELKNESGKNIWICGGADVVNQLVKCNAIDKYRITIIPTILGDGIKLFNVTGQEVKLKLIDILKTNGMTEMVYIKR